jgi:NADH:ubiquinone oxidoreductase subunit F (NADH-binding)/NADH:ubiquinone oxidoreductase subunit E
MLSRRDVRAVARILGLSPAAAWGAATFYSMHRLRPAGKYHIQVDSNVPAILAGADALLASLQERLGIAPGETTPNALFSLSRVEDLGAAGTSPALMVNETLYETMSPEKADSLVESLSAGILPSPERSSRCATACSMLLRNCSRPRSETLSVYRGAGGYRALETAVGMSPDDIISIVERAGLRGRGGAGYPTARKWRLLAGDERPAYLICNADEGEPGTFKDRHILERDPHLLVEGIAVAARAIGARRAFAYLRGEYRAAGASFEGAVRDAKEAGLLRGLEITVHYGAGSYLCGEETALISSLEGGRGEPRPRPPYPTECGLYGSPTVVNNVETLASLPLILEKGPDTFRKATPLLFSVSGHVNKPGLYEHPLGTPLAALLEAAGGVMGDLKAVIVGGLSSPILSADKARTLILDYEECREAGTSLGSGAVIVMNDTVSIPFIAHRTAAFFSAESCGLCAPCREGMHVVSSLLGTIARGRGTTEDCLRILEVCRGIRGSTLCPAGDSFALSIESMLRSFHNEFSSQPNR